MRGVEVHRIRLGFVNAYVVRGDDGCILVDTGMPGKQNELAGYLKHLGIHPESFNLIVLTHAHMDHVGGASSMKRLLNCPVAVGEDEMRSLEKGTTSVPVGATPLGRAAAFALRVVSGERKLETAEPDLAISDEMRLDDFGFKGRMISTPGHTKGSISLLLDSGEAFVGDLVANYLPFGIGPAMPPPFAEDLRAVYRSWETILSAGVTTVMPGHGYPFGIDGLKKAYVKRVPLVPTPA